MEQTTEEGENHMVPHCLVLASKYMVEQLQGLKLWCISVQKAICFQ